MTGIRMTGIAARFRSLTFSDFERFAFQSIVGASIAGFIFWATMTFIVGWNAHPSSVWIPGGP